MDIRQITPRYNVSPQINAEDAQAIADAGIVRVICNRPDSEVPLSHQAKAVEAAVRAAGMDFAALPLTHQTMTPDNIAAQQALIDSADGPVLAYCASGTRCTVIWALGQAGKMPVDEILATANRAGYAIDGLKPTLNAMTERG
ncbi:TIGR01244 family sulfur transferase [Primorskyibacter marinus]|uniref:TIGR01244 family sulfur transferase n=1 Tax=Primorskyibacter marinus TaxID=1977320 RepID=UPI000E3087B6|nr:TIGR01244 family sulfur transferase [Primorskyibacter marinus]